MNRDEQIRQRILELKSGWADMRNQVDTLEAQLAKTKAMMSANAGAIAELKKLLPEDTPPADD